MILIVETEPASREILRRLLTRHGFRLAFAATAAEVDQVVAANRDVIRVALVDRALADVDPCELIARIHAANPAARLVVCAADEVAPADLPCEARVLRKPYQLDELLDAVRLRNA